MLAQNTVTLHPVPTAPRAALTAADQEISAALPSAAVLAFPIDRARPPTPRSALSAGQLSEAVRRLRAAVDGYAAAIEVQRVAVANFTASTEELRQVAIAIGATNGSVQEDIARILNQARVLRDADRTIQPE